MLGTNKVVVVVVVRIKHFNMAYGVQSKYGLLTKCEVKVAGYWPSSFFACL